MVIILLLGYRPDLQVVIYKLNLPKKAGNIWIIPALSEKSALRNGTFLTCTRISDN